VLEGDLAKLLVGLQQELAKLVCVNRHARLLAARAPSPWFAEVRAVRTRSRARPR
jgi:hypothetical protein